MTAILSDLAALPGLWVLCAAMLVAGLVRGFTGFGTAMIFVPVAGRYLAPEQVIAVMALTGLASAGALVPRAWREGERAEVGRLALAACLTVPVGMALIPLVPNLAIRWIAISIAAITLIALVAGWRYQHAPGSKGLLGIGAGAGLMGGLAGLTGPLVILFYLAGTAPSRTVRANTILFLAALDVVLVANLAMRGEITAPILVLAACLGVPYLLATALGQAAFRPGREGLYRNVAYAVIGVAILTGLPLWGS